MVFKPLHVPSSGQQKARAAESISAGAKNICGNRPLIQTYKYAILGIRTLKIQEYRSPENKGGLEKMLNESSLKCFVSYWIEEVKSNTVKPATLNRLKSAADALQSFPISEMRICDIRLSHIQQYINQLVDAGYGYNTITKQRLIVTAPLRYAYQADIITKDCTAGVKLPNREATHKPEKDVQPLSAEDQAALLELLHSDAKPTAPLIEFMLETGLRVGEAQALSWKNVDFDRKCISVRATVLNGNQSRNAVQGSPKTRSSVRTIPISMRAFEILTSLKKNAYSIYVFSDENGLPLKYGRIQKHYQRLCKRASIPNCGLHSLRHTFATNCYHNGCDVKILSKLLGHSSTSVTYNTYIDLFGEGVEEMRKFVS